MLCKAPINFFETTCLSSGICFTRKHIIDLYYCCNFVQGSSIPGNLAAILRVYELNTPPLNITVKQLFDKIIGKVSFIDYNVGYSNEGNV